MIKIDNVRFNGLRHEWVNTKPAHTAFKDMVIFELGYGGRVIALARDKVTVRTAVMSCVDETTFSGTVDEMRPLIEIANVWCHAQSDERITSLVLDGAADDLMKCEPGRDGVRPLITKLAGPMFVGQRTINGIVRASVAALLGPDGLSGPLNSLSTDLVVDALFMALSGEMEMADALAALT